MNRNAFDSVRVGCALVILIGLAAGSAVAEDQLLFADHAILDVTLTGPVYETIKDTRKRTEQPFVLSANGQEHEVMVKVRGKSRATLCRFPPLRMRFSSSDTRESVFAGQRKIKLVTHCNTGHRATVAMLREYAAYRMFALLSDASFRARLLRINYRDTKSQTNRLGVGAPQYAFLLEPTGSLGIRIGGTPMSVRGISRASLDDRQEALVYVFHYLIGNIDWSLVRARDADKCCHNGELVALPHTRYVVPYDFDLSRFVNARYKVRNSGTQLRSVPYRKYQGYCLPEETLRSALREVTDKRDEILAVVEDLPALTSKDAASSLDYLGAFFEDAQDAERLLKVFTRNCLD